MAAYGRTSNKRLDSCHPKLQQVFRRVVQIMDNSILCGERIQEEQDALYYADPPRTKVKFPDSKHNSRPSRAVDAAPYPIDWSDRERFSYFAGIVKGVAAEMGIDIRWGGDWDGDGELKDNNFDDLPHFELADHE